MSGPIYGRNRRDTAEPEVVEAFLEGGATIERLDRPCDLLVGLAGVNHLVEVKTNQARLRETQETFRKRWRGGKPVVVRTAAQARKWLRMWSGAPVDWTEAEERAEAAHLKRLRSPKNEDAPA